MSEGLGPDLYATHRQALAWLAARDGAGVLDRLGRLVARGDAYRGSECAQVWLRLVTTGHIEPSGRNRLRLTDAGMAMGLRELGR